MSSAAVASQSRPRFTFINNRSDVGTALTAEQQKVVRKHCRNRWRHEREAHRKAEPEIRIIKFTNNTASTSASASSSTSRNPALAVRSRRRQPAKAIQQPPPPEPFDTVAPDEFGAIPFDFSTLNELSMDTNFASLDPFDVLPLPTSDHTSSAIHFYLHDQSNHWAPTNSLQSIRRSKRKDLWMPIAARDEAAYCALLAHIHFDPTFPITLRDETFAQSCLTRALALTSQRLADVVEASDDATLFAVSMLNFTSWSTLDFEGMVVHLRGLEIILAYRSGFFIHAAGYASSSTTLASPLETRGYEYGFLELCEAGLLDSDLSNPFRYYLSREQFCSILEHDLVATNFLLDHIGLRCCNLNQDALQIPTSASELLENACHATIHICSFLVFRNPWTFQGTDDILALEECVSHAHRCVFAKGWHQRIGDILDKYPLVLLWISIAAGAGTKDPRKRHEFKWLLERTKQAMNLWDFEKAADLLATYFTWPEAMTERTRGFWAGPWLPDDDTGAQTTQPSRPFGSMSISCLDCRSKSPTPASSSSSEGGDSPPAISTSNDLSQTQAAAAAVPRYPHPTSWVEPKHAFPKPLQHYHCLIMSWQLMLNQVQTP